MWPGVTYWVQRGGDHRRLGKAEGSMGQAWRTVAELQGLEPGRVCMGTCSLYQGPEAGGVEPAQGWWLQN